MTNKGLVHGHTWNKTDKFEPTCSVQASSVNINCIRAKCCRGGKHVFVFHVIPLHWHTIYSWNSPSYKNRTHIQVSITVDLVKPQLLCPHTLRVYILITGTWQVPAYSYSRFHLWRHTKAITFRTKPENFLLCRDPPCFITGSNFRRRPRHVISCAIGKSAGSWSLIFAVVYIVSDREGIRIYNI